MQLIDPTSTTANFQTPLLRCDVAVAQRVMKDSCEPHQLSCHRSGVAWRTIVAFATPVSSSAADTDLPQPDRLRHLMSLADTLRSLENRTRRAAGRISGLSCRS